MLQETDFFQFDFNFSVLLMFQFLISIVALPKCKTFIMSDQKKTFNKFNNLNMSEPEFYYFDTKDKLHTSKPISPHSRGCKTGFKVF